MSSFRKVIPALAVIFFLIHSNGFAQQFDEVMSSEALRPFWSVYGFGASAFTLLNNSQLATDISSTQYNPAFLTNIKRPKASITGKSFSVKQLSIVTGGKNPPGLSMINSCGEALINTERPFME